jgi:hypothetical protein
MSLPPLLSRSLVSLTALAGLAGAFVLGTSYGGTDHAGTRGERGPDTRVSPAAFSGSDLSVPGSCDDLLDWYVERGLELVGPYGWAGNPDVVYDFAQSSVGGGVLVPQAAEAAPSSRGPLAPSPVRSTNGETGTNVQEAGVDEPDVVKTDGHTLFRVQDGDLVTYDVSGAEVERLTSLDLPHTLSGGATEILLAGDTVVALSHRDDDGARRAETRIATIDVSDPADPEVTHTVDYDSGLVTARLHDGVVRLVLGAGLPDLDFTFPDRTTTDYEATEANQAAVRASTIGDWLPGASLDEADREPLLACEDVAVPDDGASLGTLAVVGFDASAPEAPSVRGLAADTDLAYASADQLYLATSPTFAFGCWECLPPGPAPESGGFLPGWLTGRRGPATTSAAYDGSSHLYAFDLDGIDTTFAASGQVDGVIRDRWSMDAVGSGTDAVLRVAVGPSASTGDFNSVVTFRQEGNDLVEAGRLDDLGVGEQIESVRWFDTLAIVVTFRQVDPLYAVDLTSDQPRLMGSLKIPGYSGYLHPLGRHRLLGLGQLQGERGAWGAQAGLFNVTDLTHPRQLDVVEFGPGSQALAAQDPRQLTWLPDGRTVLTVVAEYGDRGNVGYVSVLTLGDGELSNRMVEVEHGDEVTAVRLVPLADGRVVLVTGDGADFFDL